MKRRIERKGKAATRKRKGSLPLRNAKGRFASSPTRAKPPRKARVGTSKKAIPRRIVKRPVVFKRKDKRQGIAQSKKAIRHERRLPRNNAPGRLARRIAPLAKRKTEKSNAASKRKLARGSSASRKQKPISAKKTQRAIPREPSQGAKRRVGESTPKIGKRRFPRQKRIGRKSGEALRGDFADKPNAGKTAFAAKRRRHIFKDGFQSWSDNVGYFFDEPIPAEEAKAVFVSWYHERAESFTKAMARKLGFDHEIYVNLKIWGCWIVQDYDSGEIIEIITLHDYDDFQFRAEDVDPEKYFEKWTAWIEKKTKSIKRLNDIEDDDEEPSTIVWGAVKGFSLYLTTAREPTSEIRPAKKTAERKSNCRMGRRNQTRPRK